MSIEVTLPDLGEGADEAEITEVLVAEGDNIDENQDVVEVETGKATIPVPSDHAGKVSKIHVSSGDSVSSGQLLLTLDADSDASESDDQKGDDADDGSAAHGKAADEGESQEEQEPEQKNETTDEKEHKGQPATDEDQAAENNQKQDGGDKETSRGDGSTASSDSDAAVAAVPASPSVRRLAREIGVPIQQVDGSGKDGRISIDDVKAFARQRSSEGGTAAASASLSPVPDFSDYGEVRREALKGIRKASAAHLAECWARIPHVTHHDKADITELDQLRRRYAETVEIPHGGSLTVTAMLLKIAAIALKKFPRFNSSFDEAASELIYKDYINIGVAVDTDKGLVVPVIKDVASKGIVELAGELTAYAEDARDGRLKPEDMRGGCFTISNLGGIGGHSFTPIVNWPEVAILGVSRARMETVYRDGQAEGRLLMPLSLSYDHRVIDGADAARFVRWLCSALEQPLLTLL